MRKIILTLQLQFAHRTNPRPSSPHDARFLLCYDLRTSPLACHDPQWIGIVDRAIKSCYMPGISNECSAVPDIMHKLQLAIYRFNSRATETICASDERPKSVLFI